ncbi:PEP-CTERM sorting domain-containing protein [Rhodospirillaceae bacterium SYSU D60014]|uniref:PEP-CTERM sorting domain-containing protein n=1 Tax=Virgifigura deserti TaxID=2268457 RepID=UPI000E6741F9
MWTRFAKSGALAALVIAALHMATLRPAEAVPITEAFTGTITFAESGNPFGANVGGPVNVSVTYDDALLTGLGEEFVSIDSDAAFDLNVTFGSVAFVANQDSGFGSGFPELSFFDGKLVAIDFVVDFVFGDYLDLTFSAFDSFTITDNENFEQVLVSGTLGLTAVPEPGTLALIGAGLAGLGLIRRKLA